jgi:hypothetical protein
MFFGGWKNEKNLFVVRVICIRLRPYKNFFERRLFYEEANINFSYVFVMSIWIGTGGAVVLQK